MHKVDFDYDIVRSGFTFLFIVTIHEISIDSNFSIEMLILDLYAQS